MADLLVHVVDGSDPDPLGQIAAVHEVLAQIHAAEQPEQLVINKIDQADPQTLAMLRSNYAEAVFVSAKTGEGLSELRAVIEARLPQPQVPVTVLIPWDRGDLVDRIHRHGELVTTEHTGDGTRIVARVNPDLAGDLQPFLVV